MRRCRSRSDDAVSGCLEDWIGEDNPVHVVDVFVEEPDLAELGFGGVAEITQPLHRLSTSKNLAWPRMLPLRIHPTQWNAPDLLDF